MPTRRGYWDGEGLFQQTFVWSRVTMSTDNKNLNGGGVSGGKLEIPMSKTGDDEVNASPTPARNLEQVKNEAREAFNAQQWQRAADLYGEAIQLAPPKSRGGLATRRKDALSMLKQSSTQDTSSNGTTESVVDSTIQQDEEKPRTVEVEIVDEESEPRDQYQIDFDRAFAVILNELRKANGISHRNGPQDEATTAAFAKLRIIFGELMKQHSRQIFDRLEAIEDFDYRMPKKMRLKMKKNYLSLGYFISLIKIYRYHGGKYYFDKQAANQYKDERDRRESAVQIAHIEQRQEKDLHVYAVNMQAVQRRLEAPKESVPATEPATKISAAEALAMARAKVQQAQENAGAKTDASQS